MPVRLYTIAAPFRRGRHHKPCLGNSGETKNHTNHRTNLLIVSFPEPMSKMINITKISWILWRVYRFHHYQNSAQSLFGNHVPKRTLDNMMTCSRSYCEYVLTCVLAMENISQLDDEVDKQKEEI